MKWAEHVARMGERNVYHISVRKPEGKGPLGRPRRRWEEIVLKVWVGCIWLRIGTSGGLLRTR